MSSIGDAIFGRGAKKPKVSMKKKPPAPSEFDEQSMFVQWLRVKKIDHFSVPNENNMSKLNKKTAIIQGARAKKTGMQSGVQDIIVLLPWKILFIEMKRRSKSLSKVSENQMKWSRIIKKYKYAEPTIAYGYKDAVAFVEKHSKD